MFFNNAVFHSVVEKRMGSTKLLKNAFFNNAGFDKAFFNNAVLQRAETCHARLLARKSLLNLRRRTVNLRHPERARNEGSTGPKRLDDYTAGGGRSLGERS